MSIRFYKDSGLTNPVTQERPLSFVLGTNGGEKETSVWIGDSYHTLVMVPAVAGATTLTVQDASHFAPSGRLWINGQLLSYTSKQSNTLQGLLLPVDVPAGTFVYPHLLYTTQSNFNVRLSGSSLQTENRDLMVQTKRPDQTSYSLPGGRILYPNFHGNPHECLEIGYRCNEAAGDTVGDYSGHQRHAQLDGQSWTSGCQTGSGALLFVGAGSLQATGSISGSENGTVELVLKPSSPVSGNLFTAGTYLQIAAAPNPTAILSSATDIGEFEATESLVPGQWNHLVVAWSYHRISFYINGVPAGDYLVNFLLGSPLTDFVIGDGFSGEIDEVRVYSRELSYDEVLTRYNGSSYLGLTEHLLPLTRLDVKVTVKPGDSSEFNDWMLQGSLFYDPDKQDYDSSPIGFGYVYRHDQGFLLRTRVLDTSKQISDESPGFVFGEYRWRDERQMNSSHVLPTRWNIDPNRLGPEKFLAGIGGDQDLELVELLKPADRPHTILPRIRAGFYFTGPNGYYLPDDNCCFELHSVPSQEPLELSLGAVPAAQKPIFVGSFLRDEKGVYEAAVRYRYIGGLYNQTSRWDEEDDGYQFELQRQSRKIVLNQAPPPEDNFLCVTPAVTVSAVTKLLELPVYPVQHVWSVVVYDPDSAIETPLEFQYSDAHKMDGTISVTFPIHIPPGLPVYLKKEDGLAVIYEDSSGQSEHRLLDLDLNPAFSGISSGFLYLQHSEKKTERIELFADKPRLAIPATHSSILGLVAFGPVYYENDYALLMATAYGSVPGSIVPNVRLRVTVGEDFVGKINYKDPRSESVEVVTGADGTASFIYTPSEGYGFYIAKSVEGFDGDRTLTLPTPIAISQIWNEVDGWLVRTYKVRCDDPFFGRLGSLPVVPGQITWSEVGVKGTTSYKTNGRRVLLGSGALPLLPADAMDVNGRSYLDPLFNGEVKFLTYPSAIPQDAKVGAYFITYLGRVTLQVQTIDTNILSNSLLLQLDVPPILTDDSGVAGYLRLGPVEILSALPTDFTSYPEGLSVIVSGNVYVSTGSEWENAGPVRTGGNINTNLSGLLNIYRLGGAPILPINVLPNRF